MFNEKNEMGADLQDEYLAIQEAELFENSPEITEQDLELWYLDYLERTGQQDSMFAFESEYTHDNMVRDFYVKQKD